MPNARPARSVLAKISRRQANPASGSVRMSRPLAQKAL